MSLDPELQEMRRLGHRAVDLAIEHLAGLDRCRVRTDRTAAGLRELVAEPLPRRGLGLDATLQRFFGDLLPHATLVNHPRFFAYIPGPGSFHGAIGEWVAAATNTFTGTWLGGAAMAQLELQTLAWLVEALALPAEFAGIVTSGGSMANLGALVTALHGRDRACAAIYCSEQAHYSVAKAAAILGVPAAHVHRLPADDGLRLRAAHVVAQVAADRRAGLEPAVLIANAGATNTGTIDPLEELADVAARERLWFHVDAAYGAAVALLPEGRTWLNGWTRADSVTLDPHKWFYAPFDCGCLLTRHVARLENAFGGDAPYMQDIPRDEVNFFRRGPELSRGARALKLWFLLRSAGVDAIAAAVRQDLELCNLAHELLAVDPRIEILTPPRLSLFTFALRDGDAAGRALVDRVLAAGFAMLSSTVIAGRFAIRFCVCNHRTTEHDVRTTVAHVLELIDGVPRGR